MGWKAKENSKKEVSKIPKPGMRRPDPKDEHRTNFSKNDQPPVPEIQGKAKHGNEKAGPIK